MRTLTPEIKQAIREAYAKLAALPQFTTRRSQREMVALVAEALTTTGGVAAIQAPTGTGKSIGALLPAIPIAKSFDRRLVISTATVALQEQYLRDLPRLLSIIGIDASVVVAKGRSRYLCQRQFASLSGGEVAPELDLGGMWTRPPSASDVDALAKIGDAIAGGWDGDFDQCPTTITPLLRSQLTTTSSACGGQQCPFASSCSYLRARSAVEGAQIVVTNHDLLLADLGIVRRGEDGEAQRGGVLLPSPADAFYVVDEAHRLAEKACDSGALSINLLHAATLLKDGRKAIAAAYRSSGRDSFCSFSAAEAHELFTRAATALRELTHDLDEQVAERLDSHGNLVFKLGQVPKRLRDAIGGVLADIGLSARIAQSAAEACRQGGAGGSVPAPVLAAIGHLADRLDPLDRWAKDWSCNTFGEEAVVARWLSKDAAGLSAHSAPCEAGAVLRDRLWPVADGVILMSATLALADDFGLFAEEVALPSEATVASLASPFNLAQQGHILLPDMPTLPNDPGHPAAVAAYLDRNRAEGATLCLFTSRSKLRACYEALSDDLKAAVLLQGDAPLEVLLERHRSRVDAGQPSILFGMSAMGEGLDLPGDLCRRVVVTGLPFAPPDDPVSATLCASITEAGGDAFAAVTVPRAIRTLVQWCGRLIRTHDDHGEIVILDRRIRTKAYGRRILAALPPFARDVG